MKKTKFPVYQYRFRNKKTGETYHRNLSGPTWADKFTLASVKLICKMSGQVYTGRKHIS